MRFRGVDGADIDVEPYEDTPSTPRLSPELLAAQAFAELRHLERLAVETRNFAGFPYAPSIAHQPWARTLKHLSLRLCPTQQGIFARTRVGAEKQINARSNFHAIGSLAPLIGSCPLLESLSVELSFGILPASAWPRIFRPLKMICHSGRLKDLRIGLLCLPHALMQPMSDSPTAIVAVNVLDDMLDLMFQACVDEESTDHREYHRFFSLEVFHLVNLEGPFVEPLPIRLQTLKKLLFSVKNVKELAISGFRFPFPLSGTVTLQR